MTGPNEAQRRARTLAAEAAWGSQTPRTPAEWDAAVKRFLTAFQADEYDEPEIACSSMHEHDEVACAPQSGAELVLESLATELRRLFELADSTLESETASRQYALETVRDGLAEALDAVTGPAGTGSRIEARPADPPFILRISTRDGSKTLGLLRDSDCQEAGVYDAEDLVRRLNEATAEKLAELRVTWRQGGTDAWVEVSHPGWQSWECPKCGGKLSINSTNATGLEQVLRMLGKNGRHSHVGLAARWDEIEAAILAAYEEIGTGPGSLVLLAEIRDVLGERYPRPGVDEALVRLVGDERKTRETAHLFPVTGRALTQADLDAALMLGDEWAHQLMIEEAR